MVRNGETWSQQAFLKPASLDSGDRFGAEAEISGDGNTVIVGAADESSNSAGVNGDATNNDLFGSGCAFVFFRTGVTWAQQAYLKASNPGAEDKLVTFRVVILI